MKFKNKKKKSKHQGKSSKTNDRFRDHPHRPKGKSPIEEDEAGLKKKEFSEDAPKTGPLAFLKRIEGVQGKSGGKNDFRKQEPWNRRSGEDRRQEDRRSGRGDRHKERSKENRESDRPRVSKHEKDREHSRKDRHPIRDRERGRDRELDRSKKSRDRNGGNRDGHRERDQRYGGRDHDRPRGRFKDRNPESSFEKKKFKRGRGKSKRDDQFFEKKLSSVQVLAGDVQKNRKGFAFLLQEGEDIYIPAELAESLVTGDHVQVWYDPRRNEVLKVEVKKRALKSFIGTYEERYHEKIVILEDRMMREEVSIKETSKDIELKSGDKVLVEITTYEPRLIGNIVRTFGANLAPRFDTLAVVVKSQWPQEFSREAIEEAEKLSKEIQEEAANSGYRGRKDLRSKPFVTIDGKDSRDFDDAVLVEKTQSGYVLYVAIADVGEFVRPGTVLDEESYGRATSVYFPEWVIPMLPEALSNGACSLRPDEDKLTLTCEIHYDFDGKKKSSKIYESVIRSHRRCIYEDVYQEFKQGKEEWKIPFELYEIIKKSRFDRGALDLDLPESKLILDKDGDTVDIVKQERVDSHRLIEEFMIAANETVTEVMEKEGWPFIYRVHEPPQAEALARFERFAIALGLKPRLGEGNDPKLFASFISTLKENPYSKILYYLMLRSLKQARYDSMNLKHFGLASKAYTHFTSPIRRYPDLMVHRILKRYARHEPFNEEELILFQDYLIEACQHCSKQERKAEDLDRSVIKVKKARFMAKKYGEVFNAKITNVNDSGAYVELQEAYVEGLVPVFELGRDRFDFIEERMMLQGRRSGIKYRIGDDLKVCLLKVDVENGFIDFTLAENLGEEDGSEDEDRSDE